MSLRFKTTLTKPGVELTHFQSSSEAQLIDEIHKAMDSYSGIIINAGGLSHTSICLRDALDAVSIPVIEVHLSNIFKREEFRKHSYISEVATGVISGLGAQGYILAFGALLQLIKQSEADEEI